MNTVASTQFEFDPYSMQVMSNPPSFYRVLRDRYPVYYLEKYDTYYFSRYEDLMELLSLGDNTLVSTETTLPSPEYLLTHRNDGPLPLASVNPMPLGNVLSTPYYDEMRLAHMAPFRPKAAASLRDFMRECARERLKLLLPRREFDLATEYAGIVAASVVLNLFELPLSLAGELLGLVNGLSRYDPETSSVNTVDSIERTRGYIIPAIQKRRAAGADGSNGLIDGLINYRMPDGRALDDEEIKNQLVCAMLAGTESAPKIAAHGIFELWQRPNQLAAVRADLDRNVPIAVNEIIRYCSPIQSFFRTVQKDVTIAGQSIKAGQRVSGLLYSALRDEREFEDPDSFIWDRPIRRNLAFGFGQHHCVGKHVATNEIQVLIHEFLSLVQSFRFITEKAVRNPSYFQWGWTSLPVAIDD
jgi:cytochrome P450